MNRPVDDAVKRAAAAMSDYLTMLGVDPDDVGEGGVGTTAEVLARVALDALGAVKEPVDWRAAYDETVVLLAQSNDIAVTERKARKAAEAEVSHLIESNRALEFERDAWRDTANALKREQS